MRAIVDAPAPTSASKLKSFLGMLSYYSKFLPNLSSLVHPLYRLLKKNAQWECRADQAKAFAASKELLISSNCLTHFNSELDISLACDASNYGLGAVLSHKFPDGSERPIAYVSRTLNAITCSWRKRGSRASSESSVSTIISLVVISNWSRTTSLFWASSRKIVLLQSTHHHASSVGHCFSRATSTHWCFATPQLMQMQMLSVSYRYPKNRQPLSNNQSLFC